ncbi:MAG: GspE/PulE family protein [Gemmataceae bacterium]|nr:GspE/PulE family protein [Gemmataceae bacterium]MDW8267416.1 GspE/PulE family protein [Gemmataceae bacterium]
MMSNTPGANGSPKLLDLDKVKIDPAVALLVSPTLALRRQVLPFARHNGFAQVACANPHDTHTLHVVERQLQMPVRAEQAEPESLKRALQRVYGSPQAAASGNALRANSIDRALEELESEGAVALGQELLHAAILRQASDIHIDVEKDGVVVRFRVDGVLETYRKLPPSAHSPLISRLKVLCGMDIAEKRAPQDGGFRHTYGPQGQSVDIRAATLPTKYGERMTLRLLALQAERLTLEQLGMSPAHLTLFEQMLDRPHGLILLTGPTGSGKSTTLYASLRRLTERESLNIVTVEDPIEYEIPGVAQVEVDSADKVSFSKALRSILRHDPDVVMIGEIRDTETAGIAIKAALTGHLVFSTLHTNNAVGVVTRLADMGIERYLIGASLRLAVAQRLVRRLCPHCREPHALSDREAASLGRPELAGLAVHRAVGCAYCGGKGYYGRVGLFELLPLDETMSRRIADGAEEPELVAMMRQRQIGSLLDDAVEKLRSGTTTVSEVLSAVTVW